MRPAHPTPGKNGVRSLTFGTAERIFELARMRQAAERPFEQAASRRPVRAVIGSEGATMTEVQQPPPWLEAYPPGVSWRFEPPREPLFAALDRAAERFPDHPAVDFLGKVCSYAELARMSRAVAGGLQALGVEKGTRVALLLPNTLYYVACYYGILRAGGIVVNCNPLYSEAELERQLEDSGARLLVTMDLALMLPKVLAIAGRDKLDRVVVCSMAAALPTTTGLLFRLFKRGERARAPADAPIVPFTWLTDGGHRFEPVEVAPEDIAVLQYTGGTTGIPKGAMLTHANLVANREQVIAWDPGTTPGQERMLGVLPLFHVFAMTVVMNLAVGIAAEMILLPRFHLAQVLRTIHRRRPTLFPVVPTLLSAMNESPLVRKYDLTSLRFCISGGASLPVEVKERFEANTGCVVVEGYGLTEASPVVTCNPPTGRIKAGSIGLPIPGTEVEIRDLEDPQQVKPAGDRGELCVRGPQVMQGYWRQPEETAQAFVAGALRTGDVGYMDEEGYFYLVDRIKDLIIVHGHNVYPRTIEEAIYEHEAVLEATVIGVPDARRGQIPKAFVRLREGAALDAENLIEFLRPRLAPYELPREVEFRAELPKTMIGKLSKKELVAEELRKRQQREAGEVSATAGGDERP